jgi:DNA-nicking Smr family endonuclease
VRVLPSGSSVARKKKKKSKGEEELEPAAKLGGEAKTSLRSLLDGVVIAPKQEKKAAKSTPPPKPRSDAPRTVRRSEPPAPSDKRVDRPSETLRGDDRIAYWDAISGVKPLRGKAAMPHTSTPRPAQAPTPPDRARHDDEARARLAALVAGGVRFEVQRSDDDRVEGLRSGTPPAILRALARRDASPEATVDLHGMLAAEAEAEVLRFVRRAHRNGARRVCIVHGKGLHSEGGTGVLKEAVVRALTEGGAAPVVVAFASAAEALGGRGALIVELTRS